MIRGEVMEHKFEIGDKVVIAVHAMDDSRYRNAVWSLELYGEKIVWTVEGRFSLPLHGTSTFEYTLVDESCYGRALVPGADLEAVPIELGSRRIRCKKK